MQTYDETPVFFESEGETLFGIVTHPSGAAAGLGVLVLPSGGIPLSPGRNRITVRLCRELAALGFTSLRIDYHGAGESSGSAGRFHLGRPYHRDAAAGVEVLLAHGVERVTMMGSCFGARSAIAAAALVDEVDELIVFALPMRDSEMGQVLSERAAIRQHVGRYVLEGFKPRRIKGLLHRRERRAYWMYARVKARAVWARLTGRLRGSSERPAWMEPVSPALRRDLDRLVARAVPLTFVYGGEEGVYTEFAEARQGVLAETFGRAGDSIKVVRLGEPVHGFVTVTVQDAVVDVVREWAAARASKVLHDA